MKRLSNPTIAFALLALVAICTGCADKNPDAGTPKSVAPAGGGAGTPNAGAKGGGVAPPGV